MRTEDEIGDETHEAFDAIGGGSTTRPDYQHADGISSHRPSIFVDEAHETLYFVMMD